MMEDQEDQFESRLRSWFLGPKAENTPLLEELITDVLRDHVFWRRNLYTKDRAVICEQHKRAEPFLDSTSLMRQELFDLLARLKGEVPLFSPRYCAHMTSEQLIPAQVAYFATMLYNPNNVAAEASAVTTDLELEVGLQLARMVGYSPQQSWGHICSGGTIANFEAAWIARNLKFLPFAAQLAARELKLDDGVLARCAGQSARDIRSLGAWELYNVVPADAASLKERLIDAYIATWLGGEHSAQTRAVAANAVDASLAPHSLQHLGIAAMHGSVVEQAGEHIELPILIAPDTKHYSWSKSAEALGIGRGQMRLIDLSDELVSDIDSLTRILDHCQDKRVPVLMLMSVLGSTELGCIDPVADIAGVREHAESNGLASYFHIDAAWGGYLMCALSDTEGRRRDFEQVRERGDPWPDRKTFDAMASVCKSDSVTIDPHKLGYVPYPAGAVVFKEKNMRDAVSANAPYVFHKAEKDTRQDTAIGQYTLEGSKPGASAVAVWFAHRALGLDLNGYGQLAIDTSYNARRFYDRLLNLRTSDADFDIVPLVEPDTNLVCYAVNRKGNRQLADMNQLNLRIYEHMALRAVGQATTTQEFIISKTLLNHAAYGKVLDGFLECVGIDSDTFVAEDDTFPHEVPAASRSSAEEPTGLDVSKGAASHVVLLRSTFMNPWFSRAQEGEDYYLDAMIQSLQDAAREILRGVKRTEILEAYYRDSLIDGSGV